MTKLTLNQKEFLLNTFFRNEDYAGWRGIGEVLLEQCQCIVGGDKCIWNGGIGNFIKTEKYKDHINCLVYKFDHDEFFKSEWYKQVYIEYKDNLSKEMELLEQKYRDILVLMHIDGWE